MLVRVRFPFPAPLAHLSASRRGSAPLPLATCPQVRLAHSQPGRGVNPSAFRRLSRTGALRKERREGTMERFSLSPRFSAPTSKHLSKALEDRLKPRRRHELLTPGVSEGTEHVIDH